MAQAHLENAETSDDFDFEWEERSNSVSFGVHMFCGSFAGLFEHVFSLPMENIKTHMQVNMTSKSSLDIAKHIYQRQGITGFFTGVSMVALGSMPAHAAFFSIYEAAHKYLEVSKTEFTPILAGLTGAIATCGHDFIHTPTDVIKQRMQLAEKDAKLFNIINQTIRNEGIRALYRSFPITLMMSIPYSATLVSTNDTLRKLWRNYKDHTMFSYFICGAMAGATAAFWTSPLDVIKTRLQTQSAITDNFFQEEFHNFSFLKDSQKINMNSTTSQATVPKYPSMIAAVPIIIKEEGVKGFWKGVGPRMLGVAPSAAISWSVYETLKNHIYSLKSNK